MAKTVLYARVSTAEQNLDHQKQQAEAAGFKIDKVVKYWTKSPGGLYRTSFGVVMNQETYNKLSAQDKAVIDSLSGEPLARKFGQAWDK